MALTVTGVTPTTSTSNTTSYATGSFSPASGDLLVVFVIATATVAAGGMTGSAGVTTFTQLDKHAHKASGADTLYCFIGDQFSDGSAQTVTFTCTGDAATGVIIMPNRIAGMQTGRVGANAYRQSAIKDNIASGASVNPAFSENAVSGNACLGFYSCALSPPSISQPTSWSELYDQTGAGSPTVGAETCYYLSFASTTVTWASSPASVGGALIVEIDASAMPVATSFDPLGMSGFFGM